MWHLIVTAALMSSLATDGVSTCRNLHHGWREKNPLIIAKTSCLGVTAQATGMEVGGMWIAETRLDQHPKARMVLYAMSAGLHVVATLHNRRLARVR